MNRRHRRRRSERAFIFDAGLSHCLATVERGRWAFAISACGGDVRQAALLCGIECTGGGARAFWGVSAEAALQSYRGWQRRRSRERREGRP